MSNINKGSGAYDKRNGQGSGNKSPDQAAPIKPNRGAPDISTSDIMMVQESLKVKGLYRGEIDGIPGSETLRAVRSYKRQNNIPENNRLTAEFVSHLRSAF